MTDGLHPAARRVVDAIVGAEDPVAVLGEEVSGSDLTSFLLEIMRRRSSRVTPSDLVRRVASDRIVEPAHGDARALHRTIAAVLDAIPTNFEILELSPAAPLGACSGIAPVDQTKVVSALRGTEVAADPTNVLAAIAAGRPGDEHRLGAVQRVLRTQPFGPIGQQHFTVLGLVTTGRNRAGDRFDAAALIEQLGALVAAIRDVGVTDLEVRITTWDGIPAAPFVEAARDAIDSVTVVEDPARTAGHGYYGTVCHKIVANPGPHEIEIGDGGRTDWTARLTGDRTCRTMISGLGLDRLAALAG